MSKLQLIAKNSENGYGIIEESGVLFLIKQPFHADNRLIISHEEMVTAFEHGFEECDIPFSSNKELHSYLSDILIQSEGGSSLKSFDPKYYFITLPKELIELSIEELREDLEDLSYFKFVYDSLKSNPLFSDISSDFKDLLEDLFKKAKEIESVKKVSYFANLNKRELLDHIGFQLDLTSTENSIDRPAA